MFTLSMIAFGVLLPAAIAAALLALPLLRRPGADGRPRSAWAVPAGLGLALLAAHAGLKGFPRVPPGESTEWLFVAGLAATALGVAEALRPAPAGVRWGIRAAVALAALGALLRGRLRHTHTLGEAAVMVALLAAGALATWALLDGVASRARGPGYPLVLSAIAGGGALALGLSGSQLLAQLAGALACATTAAAAVAWLRPSATWTAGATAVPALAMAAAWLSGLTYADLPWASLALLAVSPALALAGGFVPLARLGPRWEALTRAAIASLPVAAAVGIAFHLSPRFDL